MSDKTLHDELAESIRFDLSMSPPSPALPAVNFGAKARTFLYRDHFGTLVFDFGLRRSSPAADASWTVQIDPLPLVVSETRPPPGTAGEERRLAALTLVKEFAERFGYTVTDDN